MDDKEVTVHFLNELKEQPFIKIILGFSLAVLKVLFGPTFKGVYAAVLILYVIDFCFGYGHAWLNPKIKPDSRKMFHGLIKLLIYMALLIVGYQISHVLFGVFIQSIIEAFIVLTETKSIFENMKLIADLKGLDIPFLNILINKVDGKMDEMKNKAN